MLAGGDDFARRNPGHPRRERRVLFQQAVLNRSSPEWGTQVVETVT